MNDCGPIKPPQSHKIGNQGIISDLHIYFAESRQYNYKFCQFNENYGPQFGYFTLENSFFPADISTLDPSAYFINNSLEAELKYYQIVKGFIKIMGFDSDLYSKFVSYQNPRLKLT